MRLINLKDISSKDMLEIAKYNDKNGLGSGLGIQTVGEEIFIVDNRPKED